MKRMSILADVLVIIVFVAIGRSAHHHGLSIGGMLSTLWPFLAGLCGAWLYVMLRQGDVRSWSSGAVVVGLTVAIGMILRVIAGQGTAFAFVLVAVAFLGLLMLGWRVSYRLAVRRTRPIDDGGSLHGHVSRSE